MYEEAYRRALEAAAREYESLCDQRREIDRRLAEVAQTVSTLSRLCGLAPTVPWGLTDACRIVLRGAGQAMTPMDVRERLGVVGFDLSRYSSSLATIHTVLKRLHESGELRTVAHGGAGHAYIWHHPSRAEELGPAVAAFMRERGVDHDAAQSPKHSK